MRRNVFTVKVQIRMNLERHMSVNLKPANSGRHYAALIQGWDSAAVLCFSARSTREPGQEVAG
jgi:hypothetical protein